MATSAGCAAAIDDADGGAYDESQERRLACPARQSRCFEEEAKARKVRVME
jgi:hypothetical protein